MNFSSTLSNTTKLHIPSLSETDMYSIMSYFGKVFLFILFGFYLFWGDEGFRKTNRDIPATAQKARLKELRRVLQN